MNPMKGFRIHPDWFKRKRKVSDRAQTEQAEKDAQIYCRYCVCTHRGEFKGCDCGNTCSCHFAVIRRWMLEHGKAGSAT